MWRIFLSLWKLCSPTKRSTSTWFTSKVDCNISCNESPEFYYVSPIERSDFLALRIYIRNNITSYCTAIRRIVIQHFNAQYLCLIYMNGGVCASKYIEIYSLSKPNLILPEFRIISIINHHRHNNDEKRNRVMYNILFVDYTSYSSTPYAIKPFSLFY